MKKLIIAFLFVLIPSIAFSQWIALQSNTTQNLYDICFINEYTGVAVGNNGVITATTNSGLTWAVVSGVPTTQPIYTTCFPFANTGYGSGQTGYVIKTVTGGLSWYSVMSCGINVRSISFINSSTGITGGGGNLMCYTTNGGSGWSPKYSPTPHAVTGLHFVNSSLLMVCASDLTGAVIHKSTNSGSSFSTVMTMNNSGLNNTYYLNSVYFKDSYTGFAAGSNSTLSGNYGTIYRSTNAGENWTGGAVIGPDSGLALNSVFFGDSLTGFAAGSNGKIMRSTNGGVNWTVQNTGLSAMLNQIFMVNALTGYVCGNGGIILKTTNGGITGIQPAGEKISDKYALHQNYPNPFNPTTIIKFQIKDLRFVTLKVFDILGNVVATLVNEQLKPGTYEIPFSISMFSEKPVPSGVYYYKLIAGDYSETKKMVLIK